MEENTEYQQRKPRQSSEIAQDIDNLSAQMEELRNRMGALQTEYAEATEDKYPRVI